MNATLTINTQAPKYIAYNEHLTWRTLTPTGSTEHEFGNPYHVLIDPVFARLDNQHDALSSGWWSCDLGIELKYHHVTSARFIGMLVNGTPLPKKPAA